MRRAVHRAAYCGPGGMSLISTPKSLRAICLLFVELDGLATPFRSENIDGLRVGVPDYILRSAQDPPQLDQHVECTLHLGRILLR